MCRVYNEIIFRTALQKEVETKVQSLDDIVKNTPLVLKFVVSYNRLEKVANGIFFITTASKKVVRNFNDTKE